MNTSSRLESRASTQQVAAGKTATRRPSATPHPFIARLDAEEAGTSGDPGASRSVGGRMSAGLSNPGSAVVIPVRPGGGTSCITHPLDPGIVLLGLGDLNLHRDHV